MKQVNVFKNFTDGVGLAAAFAAFIAIAVAHESLDPSFVNEWGKAETFRSGELVINYTRLGIVFGISALVNMFSRSMPVIGAAFAYIPLMYSFSSFADKLYSTDYFTSKPMLYIICALIHFSGSLIYIGQWFTDSKSPAKNSRKCSLTATITSFFCIAVWLITRFLMTVKYQNMFYMPYYILLVGGAAAGVFGVIWYLLARRDGDRRDNLLWSSISSFILCAIAFTLRYALARYGI